MVRLTTLSGASSQSKPISSSDSTTTNGCGSSGGRDSMNREAFSKATNDIPSVAASLSFRTASIRLAQICWYLLSLAGATASTISWRRCCRLLAQGSIRPEVCRSNRGNCDTRWKPLTALSVSGERNVLLLSIPCEPRMLRNSGESTGNYLSRGTSTSTDTESRAPIRWLNCWTTATVASSSPSRATRRDRNWLTLWGASPGTVQPSFGWGRLAPPVSPRGAARLLASGLECPTMGLPPDRNCALRRC